MTKNIHIVSGLPRSGTSMMMKMLEAGGLSPLTDNVRQADIDNPKGYYEFEPAKKIAEDRSWLPECEGRVVKMVSKLLYDLPADRQYRVIFMRRRLEEVLASQQKMLERLGEDTGPQDDEMKRMFVKHLGEMEVWLREQGHIDVLYVNYNRMLTDPARQAARVNAFVGGFLDESRMVEVVDPSLYRQRKAPLGS